MRSGATPTAFSGMYSQRAQAWLTVMMLALLYFFSYADRLVLGLLAPPIQKELGIGDAQFGLLIGTTFAVFYTIFGLIVGPLVDRYNRKLLVVVGALVWTLTTTLSAFANSFEELLVLRLGVSIGEAVLTPVAISMIADLFPREQRATPTSIYNSFAMIGSTGAFVYAAILYQLASISPISLPFFGVLSPWRSSLFLIGIPGTFLALVLLLTVREPARQSHVREGRPTLSLRETIAKNWRIYVGFFGGVSILAFPNISFFTWYPTVLVRDFGVSIPAAGSWFGSIGLIFMPIGGFCTPLMLWLCAKWRKNEALVTLLIVAMSLLSVFMVLTLTASSLTVSLIMLAPTMIFLGTCSCIGLVSVQQLVEPPLHGRIVSIYLMMYSVCGLGIGPFFVGLMSQHLFTAPTGLGHALAISSVVATLGGICLALFARRPIIHLLAPADGAPGGIRLAQTGAS